MQYTRFGRTGLQVSRLCLGTMTFGVQNSEAEGHAQLDRAFAAGINFVDTAEMYAVPPSAESYGKTEQIVGTWLKRQPRDKVILATKATGPGRSLSWIRGGPSGFDAQNLTEALDSSLKRLQTDYVDLYQLHWPARNQPMFGQWQYEPDKERGGTDIRETLEVLAGFVSAGKVRHVGEAAAVIGLTGSVSVDGVIGRAVVSSAGIIARIIVGRTVNIGTPGGAGDFGFVDQRIADRA